MRASLLLLVLAPLVATAQAPAPNEFVLDLALEVGQVRIVTAGPVRNVICDQPGIVEVTSTGEGNGFRGLAPGGTSCSFTSADGVRRTVRAVVTVPKKPQDGEASPSSR
jgi:hypothetical protein